MYSNACMDAGITNVQEDVRTYRLSDRQNVTQSLRGSRFHTRFRKPILYPSTHLHIIENIFEGLFLHFKFDVNTSVADLETSERGAKKHEI